MTNDPAVSAITPALDLEPFRRLAADCHRIGTSRGGVPWSKVGDDFVVLIAEVERLRAALLSSDRAVQPNIDAIIRAVAELSDRTSPDDWPDAMLVTADELRAILADRMTPREHFCVLCHHRWTGEGLSEHCGDCHRAFLEMKASPTSDRAVKEPDTNVILAALESRKWDKTWCGGCGVTYYRCGSCGVGVHVGKETTAGDCGGHRVTPCASTCIVAAAFREIERLAAEGLVSSPKDELDLEPIKAAIGPRPSLVAGEFAVQLIAEIERLRAEVSSPASQQASSSSPAARPTTPHDDSNRLVPNGGDSGQLLLEQECRDGDEILLALGGIPRSEGGRINLPRVLAAIERLRAEVSSPARPAQWKCLECPQVVTGAKPTWTHSFEHVHTWVLAEGAVSAAPPALTE